MVQLPQYYDLKTVQTKSPYTERELLHLAEEGKIKVGILVERQMILPLTNGENLKTKSAPIIMGDNSRSMRVDFSSAYEGIQKHNGFLTLSKSQVRGLLNYKSISSSLFGLPDSELGNEVLLMRSGRSQFLEVMFNDIRVSRIGLEQLLYHSVPFEKTKEQREPSPINDAIKVAFLALRKELGRRPTYKEVFKYLLTPLENNVYQWPIIRCEGGNIYWFNGKKEKELTIGNTRNILTKINENFKIHK